MMEKAYLDYNIWQEMYKSEETRTYFMSKTDWEYYISVAHFEELFHARNNETEAYKGDAEGLRFLMLKLSKNGILKPAYTGVTFFDKDSEIQTAINAIEKEHNTQNTIKNCGEKIISDREPNNLNSIDGIKTEDVYKEIWNQQVVIDEIEKANQKRKKIKKDLPYYRNRPIAALRLMGLTYSSEYFDKNRLTDKHIKHIIKTTEGMAALIIPNSYDKMKKKYCTLESIINELFLILDDIGFKRDNNIRKIVSGIYDVQHFIQATYCDILITKDKKFEERCKAVAWYLGIPIIILRWDGKELQ